VRDRRRMGRWCGSSLVVGCALLGSVEGAGAAVPEPVDLCALVAAPERFADRVVRVRGRVVVGPEISALWSEACHGEIWLDMPGAGPTAMVTTDLDGPGCYGRVVRGVSHDEFVEWAFSGKFKTPDALRWEDVAPPTPIQYVRNGKWRRFVRKVTQQRPERRGVACGYCPRYSVSATLVGRFENSHSGCVKREADGRYHFYGGSGFGHLNGFKSRLLVGEVVAFTASRNPKAVQ